MHDFPASELARFWSRVEVKQANECWLWTGRKNSKGYGRWQRKMSHRMAYEILVGLIPDGLILRHSCDTPLCCNPRHLIPGTYRDNSRDCVKRGRIAHGGRHGRTKITTEQAIYIRKNPEGLKGRELARRFGISESTVSYIRSGSPKTWKYLAPTIGA